MIKEIKHSQIPFLDNAECKKLGIVFHSSYKYLGYFFNDKIVGCVGWKEFKNSAYLGGSFVINEFRLNGFYKSLNIERFKILKGKVITANCTKNSLNFHLKMGGVILKKYNNGITKIKYEKNL